VVWREWTEPEAFADWFGGPASDVPLESVMMDVRVGGGWRLTMLAEPGRREIHWHGEYLEVDEPERLVFTVSDQPEGPGEVVTVELREAAAGRTEMRFRQAGQLPPDLYERAKEGWGVFFDRLAARLAERSGL
jgi:uncharacterized protein YndB with AHSA1/START domain